MIAFATLWLGLVTGTVPVELLVGPKVARVELRLDGEPCAVLAVPPWVAACELGPELAPHELVAAAFDGSGAALGEARQWLNLPRDPAELEVALTSEAGPPPRLLARLAWAGPGGAAPVAVRATLDGEPLPFGEDLARLELPAVTRGAAKLLRVEAEFPGGVRAVRELALGGDLAEQISQELTGVPVEAGRRGGRASSSEGARASDGARELPLVALEKGEADLVAVVDPVALPALSKLVREGSRQRVSRGGIGLGAGATPGTRSLTTDARFRVPLPEGARLRLVWPVAESHLQGQLRYDLFPTSPERTAADGSLLEQLGLAAMLPPSDTPPRLADAVALAALTAAQPGRRRAVLLVLGGEAPGTGSYDAATVRRFLDRLHVPLVVWSTAAPAGGTPSAWGTAETVTSVQRLESAARRLDALLGRQRIAWVEGRHLPQRLAAGSGGGLRLLSADPPAATGATSSGGAADGATAASLPSQPDGEGESAEEDERAADEEVVAHGDLSEESAAGLALPPPQLPEEMPRRAMPPFALVTDVTDGRLLAKVAAVAAALPADFTARYALRPAPEGTLLLFARAAEFRSWLASQGGGGDLAVEGFARNGVAALAVERLRSEEVEALMVHELAHLLTRTAVARQVPPWLGEGLAEELAISRRDASGRTAAGTLRVRSTVRGTAAIPLPGRATYERTLSGPAAALLALLRGPRPALDELLGMPPAAFTAAAGRPERYAASAFFVRFLLDAGKQRRRHAFQAFLAAVAAGGAADVAALEQALGTSVASLQAPFDAWLRRTAQTMR